MVLWIRGWIVTNMRLYYAFFSGRPLASCAQIGRIQSMNDTPDTILGLYWATLKMYATQWRADSWYENVLALFVLLCVGALVLSIVVGLALRCFE
jgi:hypothetical protein